ncbi:MAG: hypothetical protein EA363_00940 [Balneolaceae bacterium]|nr:MAG: hypothetical protein EA363_00940 [Balneolaceae bacterium]
MKIDLSGIVPSVVNRKIDLTSLPAVYQGRGSRGMGFFLVIFALIWGGIPGLIFFGMITSSEYDPAMLFILIFPVIGIGILLFGLYNLTFRETIRIDAANVTRESQSIFGYKYWTEPLQRYPGVLQRTERRSGGKNSSSYTLHIVELHHEDKKKRVTLYESRSSDGFRKTWEDYCRQLNKPALEVGKGKMVSRAVEDLDKSVRDLAREGKLAVDFDPRKPPPPGFDLRVDGDQLRVALPKTKNSLIGSLFIMAFAGVFIFIGFGIDDAPVAFGVIGIILLIIIMGGLVWNTISRNVLLIGREQVRILQETPWGETGGSLLNTSEIEGVRIGPVSEGTKQMAVLLVTDHQTRKIGAGLPADSMDWLKRCILAVITRG